MIISILVAMNEELLIGVNNDLPWNLKTDLKHFREYTTNKILIMGRKTFESIGRPLPNRTNIIVSKTIQSVEGAEVFSDLNSALNKAKENCETLDKNEIVIIGGGFLFNDTLDIVNKLVLTRVDCEIDGDIFYPEIDLLNWNKISSKDLKKFLKKI
jgi:dihydrofolate reductase